MSGLSRLWDVAIVAALLLAAAVLNRHALSADGFLLDDLRFIFANPLVVDRTQASVGDLLRTTALGYPIPATVATWSTVGAVAGLDVGTLHALNVVAHAAGVVAVFFTARALGVARLPAALGAALVVAHPVTAEPVAWLTQLGILLAALPALVLVVVARRWAASPADGRALWAAVVAATFLLALGFQPTTAALGLLVPYAAWSASTRPPTESAVVLGGACLAFGVAVAASAVRAHVGRGWVVNDATLGDHLFTIAAIADVHARNLVLPFDLAGWYDRPAPSVAIGVRGGVALIVGAAGLGLMALHPRTRGTAVGTGAAFAALTYAPHAGVPVTVLRFAAESHVYLPLVGLAIAAAGALDMAIQRGRRYGATAVVLAALVVMAVGHIDHQKRYTGPREFWAPVHEHDPFHPRAAWALGFADLMSNDGTETWTPDELPAAVGWWSRANLYRDPRHDYLLSLDPKGLTGPVREVLDRMGEPMASACAGSLDYLSTRNEFAHCFDLVRDARTRDALIRELEVDLY